MENNGLFKVINYNLDLEHMTGTEVVGEIELAYECGAIHTHAIWFDEKGDHYFCMSNGELDEDEDVLFEDYLLSDFTAYVNTYEEDKQANMDKLFDSLLDLEQPVYLFDMMTDLHISSTHKVWLCTDNRMWSTEIATGKQYEIPKTDEYYHIIISKYAPQLKEENN